MGHVRMIFDASTFSRPPNKHPKPTVFDALLEEKDGTLAARFPPGSHAALGRNTMVEVCE